MHLKMHPGTHHLWRAVDRNGLVLGVLIHCRRNTEAVLAFPRHILGQAGVMPDLPMSLRASSG
jgi:transposase-like protein